MAGRAGAGTSRGGERAPAAEQPAQPAPGVPAVGYMKGPAYGCGVEHDAMNGWFLSFCGTMASRPAILLSRTARRELLLDQSRRLLFSCLQWKLERADSAESSCRGGVRAWGLGGVAGDDRRVRFKRRAAAPNGNVSVCL